MGASVVGEQVSVGSKCRESKCPGSNCLGSTIHGCLFFQREYFLFGYLDDENDTELGKMLDMSSDPGSSSGCTAVVTLLRDKQLFVANAGDSRCVVCRDGRAVEMSFGS